MYIKTRFTKLPETLDYYIERKEELNMIYNLINSGTLRILINGVAGIGKTSLLSHLAQVIIGQNNQANLVWITYNGNLKSSILNSINTYFEEKDQDIRLDKIRKELLSLENLIVIIDNIDTNIYEYEIDFYFGNRCQIIASSRIFINVGRVHSTITLYSWTLQETKKLLSIRCNSFKISDDELQLIYNITQGVPAFIYSISEIIKSDGVTKTLEYIQSSGLGRFFNEHIEHLQSIEVDEFYYEELSAFIRKLFKSIWDILSENDKEQFAMVILVHELIGDKAPLMILNRLNIDISLFEDNGLLSVKEEHAILHQKIIECIRSSEIKVSMDMLHRVKKQIERYNEELSMKKRFRIGFSFPGEYRKYIEDILENLQSTFKPEEILYDKYHIAEFSRINLDAYLQKLYHDECELIVVLVCSEYEKKLWCGIEWRAIRDLVRMEEEKVMFLKVGEGTIPDFYTSEDGYISLDEYDAKSIANFIIGRWKKIPK